MSALFNFDSLLKASILTICTATYIRKHFPSFITKGKTGIYSLLYKCSVIGERLSPYVSIFCLFFGIYILKSLIA